MELKGESLCMDLFLSFRIKHFERHSQLMVVNSAAADTGEYSCWSFQCYDSGCREGEDKMGKTYIFFTG